MSVTKKPVRKTFGDYVAPKEPVHNEALGQLFSLVQQGNFGALYDTIRGKSVNVNGQYDSKVLINTIIQTNPEQISEERKLELIEYLVVHNQLYLNAYDESGLTPIHCAVQGDYLKILKYLIRKSANVNAKNISNMTPLHYATLINLRACPKENAPKALVQREAIPNVKMSEINSELIRIFTIEGKDPTKENIEDDRGTGANLYKIFMTNIEHIKKIYNDLIVSYMSSKISSKTIEDLMGGQKLSRQELLTKVSDFALNNLSDIEYPNKIINIDEIPSTIECKSDKEHFEKYMTQDLYTLKQKLINDFNKEIEKAFEQYGKKLHDHVEQQLPDFTIEVEKYNFKLKREELMLLLKHIHVGYNVTDTMLPKMLNNDMTLLKPDGVQNAIMNIVRIALPNATYIDKGLWHDDTWNAQKQDFYKNYDTLYDISKGLNPFQQFIIQTFAQVMNYYGHNDYRLPVQIIKYMNYDIEYCNAILGENMDGINTDGFRDLAIPNPAYKKVTKTELAGANSVVELRTAIFHKDTQTEDVLKILKNIQGTVIQRTYAIKKLQDAGVPNVLSVLEAKESDILGGILVAVEQHTYNENYPLFIKDFSFTGIPALRDGEDIDTYILKRIGHIEKINVDHYVTDNNPIISYFDAIKQNVLTSPIKNAIKHACNHTYMHMKQNAALAPQTTIDYNILDTEFKTNYEKMPSGNIVPDIVATFISFMLTMYARYFLSYHVQRNGKRIDHARDTGRQTSVVMVTTLHNSVMRNIEHSIKEINQYVKELSKIQEYIDFFDETFIVFNNPRQPEYYTVVNNIANQADGPFPNIQLVYDRINITSYPKFINGLFIKSAIIMISKQYKNISKDYITKIVKRSCQNLSIRNNNAIFDSVLDDDFSAIYNNKKQYIKTVHDSLYQLTLNSIIFDMRVYNAPFVDAALLAPVLPAVPTYISCFHHIPNNPAVPAVGLNSALAYNIQHVNNDQADINANYPILNPIIQNPVPAAVHLKARSVVFHSRPEIFNMLLTIALTIMNDVYISMDDHMNSDNIEIYKNRYQMFHKIIMFLEIYRIMFITNGIMHVEYFAIMSKLLKEIEAINENNLKLTILNNITNTIQNVCNAIIDSNKDLITNLQTVINNTYKQYKTSEPLFVKLNGITRSLKTIYNVNKLSEYIMKKQKFSFTEPGKENKKMIFYKSEKGHRLYYSNLQLQLGILSLPSYFKDIERMNIPTHYSTDMVPIDFDVRKFAMLSYYEAYIGWKKDAPGIIIRIDAGVLKVSNTRDTIANEKYFIKELDQQIKELHTEDAIDNSEELINILNTISNDVVHDRLICDIKGGIFNATKANALKLINYKNGEHGNIVLTDVITNKNIRYIVQQYYEQYIKKYKVNQATINVFKELPIKGDQKKNFLTNHMHAIYEQFTVDYMRAYMKHLIVKYASQRINPGGKKKDFKQFNIQISDLARNISTIDSDLKSFITGDASAKMMPKSMDVKIVEDEKFDIYAVESNYIKTDGNTVHRFYSYDYFSKQTEHMCITVNTDIIELLLKSGARTDIRDSNDMTPINYMIDGKMYYLLEDDSIRNACREEDAIVSLVSYETRNNNLYYDRSKTYYDKDTYVFIEKFKDELLRKLSNNDDIKHNIPVNIGYIFAMYACLQNIYWYRRMNKQFDGNANYDDVYYKKTGGRLDPDYNWREDFKTDIDLERHSASKARKHKVKIDKTREHSLSPTNIDDDKINALSANTEHTKEDHAIVSSGIDGDKQMFDNFALLFKNFDIPVLYSSMWKTLIDDNDRLNHNAMIHHKFHEKYELLLKGIKPDVTKMDAFDDNTMHINLAKFNELIAGSKILDTLYEPMSEFIDMMHLPLILDSNRLLLTQVRILCHILSTVLGSNMLIRCKTMLYDELKRYESYDSDKIDKVINAIVSDLKNYVTTPKVEKGYLSYDFLKAHMQFKENDEDDYEMESTDKIFMEILSKLRNLESRGIDMKNKFMTSMSTSISKYYHVLYKECCQMLLSYSDSYYRYIKNQHLSIKFVANLTK